LSKNILVGEVEEGVVGAKEEADGDDEVAVEEEEG
jgi:hypothetical protein